jgi:hypothetical protein
MCHVPPMSTRSKRMTCGLLTLSKLAVAVAVDGPVGDTKTEVTLRFSQSWHAQMGSPSSCISLVLSPQPARVRRYCPSASARSSPCRCNPSRARARTARHWRSCQTSRRPMHRIGRRPQIFRLDLRRTRNAASLRAARPPSRAMVAMVNTRSHIWRHSGVSCRSMSVPGMASWSRRARMGRSSWRSAGCTRADCSTSSIPPPSRRLQRKCWLTARQQSWPVSDT